MQLSTWGKCRENSVEAPKADWVDSLLGITNLETLLGRSAWKDVAAEQAATKDALGVGLLTLEK